MLNYGDYQRIADSVFASLNIQDDIYKTFDNDSAQEFYNQYVKDTEYISALVDIELQKYDTYDNVPSDLEDLRENAIDEVTNRLDTIMENYYHLQRAILDNTYAQIVQTLLNTQFDNVVDADVEFDPADPDVGIWDDERRIYFTLSNGSTITFEVKFEED